jgi:hypothetical protein
MTMTKTQKFLNDILDARIRCKAVHRLMHTKLTPELTIAHDSMFTLAQTLHYHYPCITVRPGHVFYEGAKYDAYFDSQSFQLYEDANDVAGLGELVANGRQAEVPALREGR